MDAGHAGDFQVGGIWKLLVLHRSQKLKKRGHFCMQGAGWQIDMSIGHAGDSWLMKIFTGGSYSCII